MRFHPPIQAKVNTGNFTHSQWRNGEDVLILSLENGICEIAPHAKLSTKPEGRLRIDLVRPEDKDDQERLQEARRQEAAAREAARAS